MRSHVDVLLLVVNFGVEGVEVADELRGLERLGRLHVARLRRLYLAVQFLPLSVEVNSLLLVLLYREIFPSTGGHLEGFFKSIRVDLFQNSLEGNEGLLKNLVPVVVGQVHDDWHQHGEGPVFVGLQDVQEVVVFKEAHGSVSHLQVNSANTFNNSLEQTGNQSVHLIDFTHFKNLLQFSQEERLFHTVSERPVSQ